MTKVRIKSPELEERFERLKNESAFDTNDKYLYALLEMYEAALAKMKRSEK